LKDYQGIVWRHIPAGGQPLHLGWNLKSSGRWNRPGIYACLYTSFTQEGALAEYRKYLKRAGVALGIMKPRELVSIRVDISPLYDFTDETVSLVPPSSSFLIGDSDDDLEKCRVLADFVRSQHYVGIVVPSSALLGEKNLNIYTDGLVSNIRELMDGPDRFPILPDGTI
jgi:RES domain-containing protein